MFEKIACPSCGASLTMDNGSEQIKCTYCGSSIMYREAQKENNTTVNSNCLDAISFSKSLEVEVNGQRFALTDLWDSLISQGLGVDKLLAFYKNNKKRIIPCVESYKLLSGEVKAELGEFICKQMNSIIRFSIEHGLVYVDEMEKLEEFYNKLKYDFGSAGLFNFKKKKVIIGKIKRLRARKAILDYDAAMYSLSVINNHYESKIKPLKEQYEQTAKTAFARRKDLKFQISALEEERKAKELSLQLKEKSKLYHKFIKRYNIEHKDPFAFEGNIDNYGTDIPKAETVKSINYEELSLSELLTALQECVKKLNVGIVTSEIEKCKNIVKALDVNKELKDDTKLYASAVTTSLKQVINQQQPMVMKAMLSATIDNINNQIETLRTKL